MPPARRVHRWRAAAVALVALATATATAAGCTAAVESGHGSVAASPTAPSSSGSSSRQAGEPSQRAAQFQDCRNQYNLSALNLPPQRLAALSFECATISVPLDYAHPGGQTISLQLVKIHDVANTGRAGSLLVNPGGPGASGIELALGLTAQVSPALLAHFDLIGFDPRGVGASSPILCLTDQQKDALDAASPDVRTPAGFATAKRTAREIAAACTSKYGSALAQYDTVNTAKDMEQIRQAVGDSMMNYLGFSYGTELGAQYAHLFPARVGVMVLDGAVDPLTSDLSSFADQLQGFESAFDQFAGWCHVHAPCRELGNARGAVAAVVATATKAPIPSSAPGETRRATPAIVDTAVLSALYSQAEWGTLGQALLAAGKGDAKGLFQLADEYNERYNGHYTNIAEANTTIGCNDSKPGPSDATIRATAASWAKRFPLFGVWSASSLFSCQQWQPYRTVPPRPTAPAAAHRILVIGNLHDPATPYQGAKDLTATLGHAELLTWDGEGHTSYLQGSSCIDGYVNAYLTRGALPPTGKTCPR